MSVAGKMLQTSARETGAGETELKWSKNGLLAAVISPYISEMRIILSLGRIPIYR